MHKCLEDLVQTYSSFLEQRLKAIDSDNTTTHERKVVFVIMIRARWNGEVIAQSDETVVVEGSHYFPIESVRSEFLQSSTTTTTCPWKGQASYYSLVVAGKENLDAAWFYPEPSAKAIRILGRVAFWRDVTIENEP